MNFLKMRGYLSMSQREFIKPLIELNMVRYDDLGDSCKIAVFNTIPGNFDKIEEVADKAKVSNVLANHLKSIFLKNKLFFRN